jgi:outer membrane lipoprotein-sorting protein
MRTILRLAPAFLTFILLSTTVLPQTPNADFVLGKMEQANKDYPFFQATIQSQIYTAAIAKMDDPETGKIWISHTGNAPRQIKIQFDKPQKEIILVDNGAVTQYLPSAKAATILTFDKGRQAEGECVALGLCQSRALIKQYYNAVVSAEESVDGVKATRLELKPKDVKRLGQFSSITLWLDSVKWLPVQTRVFEANGNYKNYKYSEIDSKSFSNSVFKLDLPKDVSKDSHKLSF